MTTDRQLLRAVKDDPEALGVFYDRHERPLLAYLVSVSGDPEVAADAAAETFAALIAALGRGVEILEPKAWLFAVAKRKLTDGQRRGMIDDSIRESLGMERRRFAADTVERIASLTGEHDGAAVAALEGLPEEQRAVVRARVIEDLSYREISERFEISPSVARKRVSRGLRRIRQTVQESTP